jgi:hypothetical protein
LFSLDNDSKRLFSEDNLAFCPEILKKFWLNIWINFSNWFDIGERNSRIDLNLSIWIVGLKEVRILEIIGKDRLKSLSE